MRGGRRRVAATSRHGQATVTRSEAALAPRRIQALVGQHRHLSYLLVVRQTSEKSVADSACGAHT
jgi:hypothetical protein